jgi:hypothetical protein
LVGSFSPRPTDRLTDFFAMSVRLPSIRRLD